MRVEELHSLLCYLKAKRGKIKSVRFTLGKRGKGGGIELSTEKAITVIGRFIEDRQLKLFDDVR